MASDEAASATSALAAPIVLALAHRSSCWPWRLGMTELGMTAAAPARGWDRRGVAGLHPSCKTWGEEAASATSALTAPIVLALAHRPSCWPWRLGKTEASGDAPRATSALAAPIVRPGLGRDDCIFCRLMKLSCRLMKLYCHSKEVSNTLSLLDTFNFTYFLSLSLLLLNLLTFSLSLSFVLRGNRVSWTGGLRT